MPVSRSKPIDFNNRLVLFKYLLSSLGAKDLSSFKNLNSVMYEGFDENGNTLFFREIDVRLSSPLINTVTTISRDKLKQYDENICRHLKQISEKRGIIHLKYFQYLSLLFTEIYLDRFFNDKDDFVKSLNAFIKDCNDELFQSLRGSSLNMENYTPDKLNKLGFMCATGSGKTLIMHINILQFHHYNKLANRHYQGMKINKTILLSPNEGMSLQHIDEFKLSNIPASLFQKDGYSFDFSKDDILVIDMNKLKEEGKVKTIAVDSFEQNNLVLIDEAHRGLQGDVWFDYRNRLSADGGFSFEYSATFKQALKSLKPTAEGNEALLNDYGKSIIIDYSYKYFYDDGYGKDYRIYNLQEGLDSGEQRTIYLTGCLLSFYQQVKIYNEYKVQCKLFEIENPLLVFVGNRVTSPIKSGSSLDAAEKDLLTDIEEILQFLDNFINKKSQSIQRIKKILQAQTNIVDNRNNDIFSQNFTPLDKIFGSSLTPEIVYNDILEMVFNSSSHSESPRLYLTDLKTQGGEIGLKIGQNGDYFGVINIGDTSSLINQCNEKGLVTTKDEFSTPSLFRNINTQGSIIKLLIGSRKFTEGWNCWRVSTMGLINFAKGEGSQAIQLFGRGVRLHGYANNLKRSSKAENAPANIPREIPYLETLTIFGIKADYMAKFKEFLETEGLPSNDQIYNYSMATVNRFDNIKGKNIKTLRIRKGINFKEQAPRYILDIPDTQSKDYFYKNEIILDCRAKVQNQSSPDDYKFDTSSPIKPNRIGKQYLQYLDFDYIYWHILQYKNDKRYFNITIDKNNLYNIIHNEDWSYGLIIPEDELKLNSFEKASKATSFISLILQTYLDKFYTFHKNRWEDPYLEYQDITFDDPNFVAEYTFSYKPADVNDNGFLELEKYVNDLNTLLGRDKKILTKTKELFSGSLIAIDFPHHLFIPLIYKSDKLTTVQVTPINLNYGEKRFIELLQVYLESNLDFLKSIDIFLLRNKSKSGMGFFEAGNFYPDYILWVDTKDKQYMTFIDPKGLLHHQKNDPKIQFYKTIKELKQRPLLQASKGKKDIILNSFIFSVTEYISMKKLWDIDINTLSNMHVLFLEQEDCIKTMFDHILKFNNY